MPTLNWIGKDAVVKHHLEVPFHLLKDVPELSCGDPGTGNIIAQGDNLIALKALLPHFAGQVKCVCIDPPYNTGNEGWAYNDNVNSPVIREWLGKVVGKEGETLDRHDRWLCMMYPRLALLKQFLSEDGVIFVRIDDNEIGKLAIFDGRDFWCQQLPVRHSHGRSATRRHPTQRISDICTNTILAYRRGPGFKRNLPPADSRPNRSLQESGW